MKSSAPEQILRVSGDSDPNRVAGAIVKFNQEGASVLLTGMGVNAVNQMVKAAIRARVMLQHEGLELTLVPTFRDENVRGTIMNAVAFFILITPARP